MQCCVREMRSLRRTREGEPVQLAWHNRRNGLVIRMKRKHTPPRQRDAWAAGTSWPISPVSDDASIAAVAAAVEAELDDALAATFPASDPVAIDPPSALGTRTRVRVAPLKQGNGQ